MNDLAVAVGLVLVLEGLVWALAPHLGVRLLAAAAEMPQASLRVAGTAAIALGVLVVWLVRG